MKKIVCPKCRSDNFNTFSCFGTVEEYKNEAGEVTGFDDASEDQYDCKDCGHTWFDEVTEISQLKVNYDRKTVVYIKRIRILIG